MDAVEVLSDRIAQHPLGNNPPSRIPTDSRAAPVQLVVVAAILVNRRDPEYRAYWGSVDALLLLRQVWRAAWARATREERQIAVEVIRTLSWRQFRQESRHVCAPGCSGVCVRALSVFP